MTRARLPDRRQNQTFRVAGEWGAFTITVGYDSAGQAREVFADGFKNGIESLADDACVLISIALQHGISPAELRKSLGTVPDLARGEFAEKPASLIGEILGALE